MSITSGSVAEVFLQCVAQILFGLPKTCGKDHPILGKVSAFGNDVDRNSRLDHIFNQSNGCRVVGKGVAVPSLSLAFQSVDYTDIGNRRAAQIGLVFGKLVKYAR